MSPGTFQPLDGMDPRLASVLELIMQIAGGDFTGRIELSSEHDALDAVAVGLHMLAESFERERAKRLDAEAGREDAVDTYESAPGLYCTVTPRDHRIVQCNRAFASLFGAAPADLVGRGLLELADASSRDELSDALVGLTSGAGAEREFSMASRPGRRTRVALIGNVARGDDGAPTRLRLLLRDVTTERELEARLLQAQRMDAIGRLAGGIAHDFNNLLAVVLGAATVLERNARADAGAEELELIRGAAERAAELTRQLLSFARHSSERPELLDVSAILEGLRPLVARLLGAHFELDIDAERTPPIRLARGHLEQCLMNLLVNARDAMPRGGVIRVRASLVPVAEHAQGVPPGEWVRVSVEDGGSGIDPEVLPAIFEPFFSTKGEGEGTGLGLSTVYGIVTQAGGHVSVESTMGEGTRFELYFPPVMEPAPSSGDERPPAPLEAAGSAGARVLLVEDQMRLRTVTAMLLRDSGFQVLEADGGPAALELLGGGEAADLVITDLTMPRMSGLELIGRLRAERPDLPVVLMSGYAVGAAVPGDVALLEKPFTPTALLDVARSALARRARAR
jgi:two-component system cell cycle sensor histidine kinase/response regulator CckA